MDLQQKLTFIRYNLDIGGYRIVAKECVGLIEQALRQLFLEQAAHLEEEDRLRVREAERKMTQGTVGVERFTMGRLVRLFRKSHFLDAWERASGKDLSNLRVINLDELTKLRNRLIHDNREASQAEAEFLLNCLRVILETFELDGEIPTGPPLEKGGREIPPGPPLEKGGRERRIMLGRVKSFWVKGVLEKSVHHAALIELGKEQQTDAVAHPWEMVLEIPGQQNRSLPPGKAIIEIFDEMGRALLILGEPGSGKTTTLLELARDAVARAEKDPAQFLPALFNLSSWSGQKLVDWLVQEFNLKYQVPQKITRQWIENHELLLLLDGLDEVMPDHRTACVEAINLFRQEHGLNDIVICCRTQEYEAFPSRLKLEGAILLQPLSPEQIDAYLLAAGPELAALRTVMQQDAAFQTLAESPLMLSIMALAYRGASLEELSSSGSQEECRKHLFDAYTETMLKRRGSGKRYSPKQTRHWLSCLAHKMAQHSQSEFFLENMQPSWLSSSSQHALYNIGSRTIGGLGLVSIAVLSYVVSGVANYLLLAVKALRNGGPAEAYSALIDGSFGIPDLRFMYVVYAGLLLGLAFGIASLLTLKLPKLPSWLAVGFAMGTIALFSSWYFRDPEGWKFFGGSALALIFGLPGGLAALPFADRERIRIAETLSWSWKKALRGLVAGLLLIAAGMLLWLRAGHFNISASDVLGTGLPIAAILILISGLTRSELSEKRTLPNQGIRRSASNAIRVGFLVIALSVLLGLSFAFFTPKDSLVEGLAAGFILGLPIAYVVALFVGGAACIQHLLLYFLLVREGQIPRKPVDFLDYAAGCVFLRKIGGGYIFVHKMLLDYFNS